MPTPSLFGPEIISEVDNDNDKNLPQMTAPSGDLLKSGLPVHNMQDLFDGPINLPQFLSKELIELIFLCNVGDGECACAKITKKILDGDAENHKRIKMLVSCDDDWIAELIAGDKLRNLFVEQNDYWEASGEDEIFTFAVWLITRDL